MEKTYNHKDHEDKIYKLWEKSGAFKAQKNKKPYTVLMPPPNANASLHAGHAMYTVDDILVRFKRMQGFSSVWLPGVDHAGFETQYVYENELAQKGKSRLDFDRNTLFKNIYKFVEDNSGLIYEQFKRLGFSADWDRSVFTLDKNVIETVYKTFKKMEKEGLVYRDDYIVNYCTHCGTSLAELEVKHIERKDPLYYIRYPLTDSDDYITVATVRPETIFGDTAIAIHPKDSRYKKYISKKVKLPLTRRIIPIIKDEMVDMEFGTGAVKITPAHDPNDFEVGKKHKLKIVSVIDLTGKMIMPEDSTAPDLDQESVEEARNKTVERLKTQGLIEKIDKTYAHSVTVCYKCGHDLEPTTIPNWFIKVKDIKKPVINAVKKDKVKFFPKKYKKHMLTWLDIMHDWPISRQIVWGIRIPAWYSVEKNPNLNITFLDKKGRAHTGKAKDILKEFEFEEIKKGLQSLIAPKNAEYTIGQTKPKGLFLQETDTFDTWFSSGQWPLVTIDPKDYKSLLPTDVLGTLSDILKFWVSRMIMFTLYLENKVPFKNVYLWSMVADEKGIKMSKSKGNVVNPVDLVEKYGADALRFSLLYGIPAGSKAILSDNKVRGMRNFANKVWNIARFVLQNKRKPETTYHKPIVKHKDDKWILRELEKTIKSVTNNLENYKLNQASEDIYEFLWHKFADIYIEKSKSRKAEAQPVLEYILMSSLKLLHPFMPFLTETIWQTHFAKNKKDLLMLSSWPKF